ncbi:MAG: hypothetical protein KJ600_06080 [Nanoarchaeota archaeon]|nr:hypothetical protein [Nanoarchaeota archaeon]MBU1104095.1 hypothetical protein [Nanoarchaeota archaeon]
MGFFDFLKKKAEVEEKKPEEISLSEINSWLQSKSKNTLEKVNSELEEIRKKITTEKSVLKESLKNLENAELKNKELPERAKQIMQGNRQIYLQKIETLIGNLNFPEALEKVASFSDSFDKELGEFDKSISKSHNILGEFFPEKAGAVSMNVKNLDKFVKDAKTAIKNSEIEKLKELENKIKQTTEKISSKKENKNKIKLTEKILQSSQAGINEKEKKIEQIKRGDPYKKITGSINAEELLKQQIIEENSQMAHSFSEIESAMKKYENLSENKLAKKYLDSPLDALFEDKEFEITSLIKAIETAVKKNEIILKDKKREKILKELSSLEENRFADFLQKNKDAADKLNLLKSEIDNSQILKQVTELEDDVKRSRTAIEEDKASLEKMKKDFDEINVSVLTKDLEDKIRECLGEEVRIAQ